MTTELISPTQKKTSFFQQIKNKFARDPFSWSVIIFVTLFFVFFMVIPLIIILINSVYLQGEFKFSTIGNLFGNKYFFDPLATRSSFFIRIDDRGGIITIRGPDFGVVLNTIVIGILTTTFSLILGTSTAFIMARIEMPGKTLISGLLLIPLVLPPFVGGVGYWALMGKEGILNVHLIKPIIGYKMVLEGIVAIVFVQTLHYFTLVYLNVYSSLMNNDPALEESAENLGASRLTVLRTVTLPLAMPGIASGSILVLILSMEDLGTPIIFAGFGDAVAAKTMTFYIFANVYAAQESAQVAQEMAILSSILLIFAVIGFFAIRKYVSLKQYAMISKGRAGEFRTIPTHFIVKILLLIYFALLLFVSMLPHIGVLLGASTEPQQFPFVFTMDNFLKLFDVQTGFGNFVKNTLVFSGIATLLIVILATLTGYVANRKNFRGQTLFDTLVTLPIAIPGIVLGLGYFRMFRDADVYGTIGDIALTLNPLEYVPIILIISFTIRKFPFTVRSVYAGLQQTDEILEEAAENMGASKPRMISGIIIPIIALNIVAGALISLVYNMSEVSTSLILINTSNHGTVTWKMADASGELPILSAMGVFLMTLQAISLFITNFLLKDRAEAITGI